METIRLGLPNLTRKGVTNRYVKSIGENNMLRVHIFKNVTWHDLGKINLKSLLVCPSWQIILFVYINTLILL